jgi:hypothetical protein
MKHRGVQVLRQLGNALSVADLRIFTDGVEPNEPMEVIAVERLFHVSSAPAPRELKIVSCFVVAA